ncbi:hypothetical protein N752_28655 [Desulforamulus aquiferis]|nr:hypothetical protein [Desulforamulus aquiferis]RYD01826.1 hypothetical protein N752_28655 [Desulforamulus aquiferis]
MVLIAIVFGLLMIPKAFASDAPISQAKSWFEQRMATKQAAVNQALTEGLITKEQANLWNTHFEQMKQYHAEYGYTCPGGGMGRCNGKGPVKGLIK